jgi:hypothetical protein
MFSSVQFCHSWIEFHSKLYNLYSWEDIIDLLALNSVYAVSRGVVFEFHMMQHIHHPIMAIVVQPCCIFFPLPLLFFNSLYEKYELYNLNSGFYRLHWEFNSGTTLNVWLMLWFKFQLQLRMKEFYIPITLKYSHSLTHSLQCMEAGGIWRNNYCILLTSVSKG